MLKPSYDNVYRVIRCDMVGQFSYLKIFLIDVRENNFKFRGNFKKGKFILKNKILGFLFRAILPKKIKAKMLRKAFQKAPTVDYGMFAEAKPVQVKGLYDPPPQNAKKGIFTEFMEKSGRAIDDEEMIIPSDFV